MSVWSKMTISDVNLETLAQAIREAGRPVHVNVLARVAVQAQLRAEAGERHYAPGAQYEAGEAVVFNGQHATVKSVQEASNPVQGHFCVLTLILPDGTEHLMAAEVHGAPTEDRQPLTEAQVQEIWRAQGTEIRRVVKAALTADARFVSCQTLQGDSCCLSEMLPQVGRSDLRKALAVLPPELADGELVSYATEELVKAVWGMEDDGGDTYALHAFALSQVLDGHATVINLGGRWASVQAWEEFTARQELGVPRVPTQVTLPDGIKPATEAQVEQEQEREAVDEGEEPDVEEPAEADLETWQLDRPTYAVLTLRARHYYEGWLPLSKKVQQLFPPLASGRQEVVFHHYFGDEPESLPGYVDREQGRIWVSAEMYETFRHYRIYPGARLRISARTEREFDIATRETDKTEPIRVWRMWLDEDGQIQYEDHEEPRRYEVDDDVYVADVRFEDREALFCQAEEVGNSIFGLMYKKAVEWWEAGKRTELRVTAEELFEAIHFDEEGRMTCKATIAWELWRRLAFKSVGGGKYVFRPKFGDHVRSLRRRGPQPIQRTKDLWAELDEQTKAALRTAVHAYMENSGRERVLFLREVAHRRIRELLPKDRLGVLTLDEFNHQIWQVGAIRYKEQSHRIDSGEAEALLGVMSIQELRDAYESGELEIEGNQTWGSGGYKFGSRLAKSDAEKEQIARDTLQFLLYSEGSVEQRMGKVIKQSNGFGINVISGILHAVYPERHILYNRRSVDALKVLGMSWPANWRSDAATYVTYRDFCTQMQEHLGFHSLTDVDWFMYQLATGRIRLSVSELQPTGALWEKYVLSLDPNRYIGWTVVHQRKLKGYYDLWANYLKFMDEHPHVDEQASRSKTSIHWRGTMHPRYLGLITEERIVTPAGKEFYSLPDARDSILHRQLQKWHYCIDLFCDPDPGYEVYPLFALLRILLSLPESEHTISLDELRYFVLATKSFEECDDRVALIRDFRENHEVWESRLDGIFRYTYVERIHHMLELSPYFSLGGAHVGIKAAYVTEAQHVLTQYQELERAELVPYYSKKPHRYLRMLRSTESIFDFCKLPRLTASAYG